jgi:hypothetical protein
MAAVLACGPATRCELYVPRLGVCTIWQTIYLARPVWFSPLVYLRYHLSLLFTSRGITAGGTLARP